MNNLLWFALLILTYLYYQILLDPYKYYVHELLLPKYFSMTSSVLLKSDTFYNTAHSQ